MPNPNRLRPSLIGLVAPAAIVCAALAASAQSFSVALKGGRASGGETLRVHRGDDVQVRFTSDRPMALHLHGYDLEVDVAPPAAALLTFKANLAGRFPIEEHGHGAGKHRPVLYIEVYP